MEKLLSGSCSKLENGLQSRIGSKAVRKGPTADDALWLRMGATWQVGPAAPVVAAAVSGNLREAGVSKRYGGQAGLQGATDAVYQGIGSVSCSFICCHISIVHVISLNATS